MNDAIDAKIRDALDTYGKLQVPITELDDDDDLYRQGLTSHASVNLMLALEDSLGVEFTDEMLRKGTFQSIATIRAALQQIGAGE
jgi:acyl carrier protein